MRSSGEGREGAFELKLDWRVLLIVIATVAAVALGAGFSRAFLGDDGAEAPEPTSSAAAPFGTPVASMPATPTASPEPPVILQAPLSVKVGQLIMAGFNGTTAGRAADLISRYHLGNVVLAGGNIGTPDDVLALTSGLQERAAAENGEGMLIAIDQEGGIVRRLGEPFTQFPPAREIGCVGSAEFSRQAGQIAGSEMMAVGINVNLAPVADVVDNPENTVIGDRAFGTTPEDVIQAIVPYVAGLRSTGAAATAKHFPGHGSTTGDSHDGPVTIDKTRDELERTQLAPFRALAQTADIFMMANVDFPAIDPSGVPAGLSAPMIRLLRDDFGFDGVIATDSLVMGAIQERWTTGQAAVMALNAGADLLLVSKGDAVAPMHDSVIAAVEDGSLSEARIDEALSRVIALKHRLLAGERPPLTEVGSAEHRALVEYLQLAAERTDCVR